MAEYTKVNLTTDVENMAPKFGMGDQLEARFAKENLELEKVGATYFKAAPGFRVPFGHSHDGQEEVYVVVSGSVRMKVGDEILELAPFDAIRVDGDVKRAWEAGDDGAVVIAFGEQTTPDQSEMEPNWWPEGE